VYDLTEIRNERARLALAIEEAKGAERKIAVLDEVIALYDENSNDRTKASPALSPATARRRNQGKKRTASSKLQSYPCPYPDCERMFGTAQGAALHVTRAHRA